MSKHRYLRRKGYVLVALQVSEENFAFATRYADQGAYFDTIDCLNALLNTAILEARDADDGFPLDEDEASEVVEDDGDHARLARGQTDLDDDIPF